MKRLIRLICLIAIAGLIMYVPESKADAPVDCLETADAFLMAADMGRRGEPVTNLMELLTKNNEAYTELEVAVTRKLFLEAYQSGASGVTMDAVWADYFSRCKRLNLDPTPKAGGF